MEFLTLTSSFTSKPHFPSSISPSTSSLSTLNKKTPFKFSKTLVKSFPISPFSTNLPLRNTKRSLISARFGGPTKRRNSLRKKLKGGGGGGGGGGGDNDSQVRQNPQKLIDPVHFIDDNQVHDSNLDSISSQIGLESGNFDNVKQSDLWDKLEGWVEQYKRDSEFWGIGSNPIFTVFQDINGNVEKVLVDEDEILKRNGVEPLYLRKENEIESFDEVKSKIAHAKFLAKELEGGKNVISKNSSVAKFVISGEDSGFVSRMRSMIAPHMSLAKVSRAGVAVVCGFVFVSVIRKLLTMVGKEEEMTSFEKEMLRRKKKSRLSKEKLQKGSVEVMEEPLDSPTVITERPLLDRKELLDSIREAMGSNNIVVDVDVKGPKETAKNTEMDSKIMEIQRMARHARKIENGEVPPSERGGMDEQISDKMDLEEKDVVGPDDSNWIDEAEEQEHVGGDMNAVNNLFRENSPKTKNLNGVIGMKSNKTKFTNEKVSKENEVFEPRGISSGTFLDDKESDGNSNSLNSTEGIQSQLISPNKSPRRRKLKIIRSVKEAREYLMQRHNQEDKVKVGDTTATATVKRDEMNNYYSQRLEEDDRESDSFDADRSVDHASAPKVSGYYTVKGNESLAVDTNELKIETGSDVIQDRPFDSPNTDNLGFDAAPNLDKAKIDDMLEASDSGVRLDFIPSDTSLEADEPFLTEQGLEAVDLFDQTAKPLDLSEASDFVSDKNSTYLADNATEESSVPHNNALHDANLQPQVKLSLSNDNSNVKLGGISETPMPTKLNEIVVPSTVGRDLNGAVSEENGLFPTEIKGEDTHGNNSAENKLQSVEMFQGSESGVEDREKLVVADKENWLEKNFHEIEPIIKKMSSGFSNNYNIAREKSKQEEDRGFDLMKLRSLADATELEWMEDDKLREIVFRVRDNELAGRDPFHSMDPEDKVAFFEGLESKVEVENQKLSTLHEWLHLNIENIDYGADGISIYDPPEKIMPRWKGPTPDEISKFLNNSRDQQPEASSLQKVNDSAKHDKVEASAKASTPKSTPRKKVSKPSKTVIEGSDGSIKPGKKSGKEFWQHTKKWSRGFVDSYNAETDPEVKSTMKDIGKDLDRWITEKEIKDAADFMDNVPRKGKEIMEKKLNKLKREMELFGPQAVVSKYREYAEVKEVDYLWWLDLPHLLCIELYTLEGEEQRVGFYSLEMAGDLEIEPKPHHVIAFEDPGDCKNFCYIIQAHLEMLGKGKAFIVPQPPKDVFRQAKANGFGVTVIRKGELTLNVDQHLEEVEELITEIGSKMYHDKIMRERSVDISSLMKGVFGVNPPNPPSKRKRKKRARKRPNKS